MAAMKEAIISLFFMMFGVLFFVFGLGDAGTFRVCGPPVNDLKLPRRMKLRKCNLHPIREAV